jgi:hypothetical protein
LQGSYLLKDKEIIQLDKIDDEALKVREKVEKVEKDKESTSIPISRATSYSAKRGIKSYHIINRATKGNPAKNYA